MNGLYEYSETVSEHPSNAHFQLHLHSEYEIFMHLCGDSNYVVEGNVYDLEPYDVIVIKKFQMHRVYHNSPKKYQRMVLSISPDFFKQYHCQTYEEKFITLSENTGNKIEASIVKQIGLYDAIVRLKKYSDNFQQKDSPVIIAAITEILYLINSLQEHSAQTSATPHLKKIITYINNHFTEELTLDALANVFFISKYHLCHIFPAATGLTVHQYITKKRLALADEMIASGKTITEAAQSAGFHNYSSFYRAYLNEHGCAPNTRIV